MKDTVTVGRHAVREATITGRSVNKVLVQEGIKRQQANETLKNAKDQRIAVQTIPESKLNLLASAPHQGIAVFIAPYEYTDFNRFLKQQKEKEGLLAVLTLDDLEDLHNLEPALRTADAMRIGGVTVPKRRSVTLTQTVVGASTNTVEYVPVARMADLAKTIDELEDNGFWIAGAETNDVTDYRSLEANMSLIIVVGSGGQDMSHLVSGRCDFYIRIPMAGHVNSLNASVTTSLMMYEIFRKRHDVGEA